MEETPKGWFITLIQKDPLEEIGEEKRLKRAVAEKAEEDRHLSALQDQVRGGREGNCWTPHSNQLFCMQLSVCTYSPAPGGGDPLLLSSWY